MSTLNFLSNPAVLALLIPIVAIVMTGIVGILKCMNTHRERMAMIEQGMHPDSPPARFPG